MHEAVLAVSDDDLVKECKAILHSASADRQSALPRAAGHCKETGFAKSTAGRTSAVSQSTAACVGTADAPSAAMQSIPALSEPNTARPAVEQLQESVSAESGRAGDDFMSDMMADLLA